MKTKQVRRSSRLLSATDMDARVARTRTGVIRAATDLLVDGGPSAVTIDAIVARSGIAKSTIYRHWQSRDEVLIDVLHTCAPAIETPPDELGFEGGLRALGRSMVETLNDPEWTRIIPALFMLKAHAAGIALIEQELEERQETAIAHVLQRGVDEGRLRADYDLEEACASIIGPLLFAHLTGKPPVDDAFADRIIDSFLDAYGK